MYKELDTNRLAMELNVSKSSICFWTFFSVVLTSSNSLSLKTAYPMALSNKI